MDIIEIVKKYNSKKDSFKTLPKYVKVTNEGVRILTDDLIKLSGKPTKTKQQEFSKFYGVQESDVLNEYKRITGNPDSIYSSKFNTELSNIETIETIDPTKSTPFKETEFDIIYGVESDVTLQTLFDHLPTSPSANKLSDAVTVTVSPYNPVDPL